MTTDQRLFEKTKREGECWAVRIPNFTTPEGFFWLWERSQEKEWGTRFMKVYGRIHNNYPVISISLINPLKFRAALMEFWGIKEEL